MTFRGARVAVDAESSVRRDFSANPACEGRICFAAPAGDLEIDLTGYLALPGLINAHDHLEFNLFPQLGLHLYANARDWARDVYRPEESPILQHREVSRGVRLVWGGLKNLLSGVTTVAHHNPYEPAFDEDFPVRVVRRFGWAHSLDFSPDVVERFRATPQEWPFLIHAAEGTDEGAREEIHTLERLGILSERTVVIHAVAARDEEWALMAKRGASVVWCPTSNMTLFGVTLSPCAFRSGVPITIGTDSAISAQTSFTAELQCAHRQHGVPLTSLYQMATCIAARMLQLSDGAGTLREGGAADFIAVPDHGQTPAEALLNLRPDAVFIDGRCRMTRGPLATRVPRAGLHRMAVDGDEEFFVACDVPALFRETQRILGSGIRLAGREVSA